MSAGLYTKNNFMSHISGLGFYPNNSKILKDFKHFSGRF